MIVAEWKWKTRDGLNLYARSWTPEGPAKAIICLIHGHGEHVNRYNHVGAAYAEAGYAVQGYDLRGHGQSEGLRGHTLSYQALMNDISDFLADARKRHPGLPVFIHSHSMGGNQTMNYCLQNPDAGLRGVIVTSPWLKLLSKPRGLLLFLLKIVNIIYPTYTQASGLDPKGVSRDAVEVQKYIDDPLVHDQISVRLFSVMEDHARYALAHANELKIPMLLIHGKGDPISSYTGSKEFAQKAGSIVTLRIWDDLYHETHNEPEKQEVIRAMIDWVGGRL